MGLLVIKEMPSFKLDGYNCFVTDKWQHKDPFDIQLTSLVFKPHASMKASCNENLNYVQVRNFK